MSPVNFQDAEEDEDEQVGDDQPADDAATTDTGGGDADDGGPDEAEEADAPSAAPTDPAKPDPEAIKAFLAQKYGEATDNTDIKAAQADARRQNMIANIGSAVEGLARSGSQAHGGQGVDEGFYQGLKQQGQQGVAQAQAARQQAIQDFLTKNQLGRQGVEDAQTALANKVKNDANNPKSMQSQIARHVWQSANPNMDFESMPGWDSMSANDMSLVKDPVDLKARLDAKSADVKMHYATLADSAATRNAIKSEAADRKSDEKAEKDQGKNYVKMSGEVMGQGRAPPDIKQALKDQQSIDKANKLFDGRDLNSLSKSEAALVAGELEKIATGGAGTEAGRAGLDPHSFDEQWSAFKNKFVGADGSVEPANIGAFLQQQKNYLQGLGEVTNDRIRKYQRGVYDSYVDGNQISPEHQEKFQGHHPELFPELKTAADTPTAKPQAAPSVSAPPAPAHPEANQAMAWAKAHPEDPRAAEIMKRLGSANAGL